MRETIGIVWAYVIAWGLFALIASGDKDVGSFLEVFRWENLIPITIFALLPFMLIVLCQLAIKQWGVLAGGGVSLVAAALLVLVLNAVITTSQPPNALQQTFATLVFAAIFLFGSLPTFLNMGQSEPLNGQPQ